MEHLQAVASRHLGERIKMEWFSRSHFSDVACFSNLDNPGDRAVIKCILPWHLDELDPAQREIVSRLFNSSTLHFRHLLAKHYVPVARDYECLLHGQHVFHVSSDEGEPVQTYINHQGVDRAELIRLIVQAIAGVLVQANPPVVGLDPQLDNFCAKRDANGNLGVVYVDVFPPLCRFGQEYLVHYPNPTSAHVIEWELNRKFRALGILRRLRFSVLSIDMDLEPVFLDQLQMILSPELSVAVGKFFDGLPDAAVKNGFNRQIVGKMIQEIPLDGIDDIREVAMRLAYRVDNSRKAFLAEVFDLSRKDPSPGHEEPHAVRFEQLKKRLLSLI